MQQELGSRASFLKHNFLVLKLQQLHPSSERPLLGRYFAVEVLSEPDGRLCAGVLRQRGQEHRRVGAAGGRDAGARGAERALRLGARAGGGGPLAVQARTCALF